MKFSRTIVKSPGQLAYHGRRADRQTKCGRFRITYQISHGGRNGWSVSDTEHEFRNVRVSTLEEVREALREFAEEEI